MRKLFSFVMLAVTVAISMAFWATMISMVALSVVFVTGSLHGSGLTRIPALSFWQSMAISLALLALLAFLLRERKNNGR